MAKIDFASLASPFTNLFNKKSSPATPSRSSQALASSPLGQFTNRSTPAQPSSPLRLERTSQPVSPQAGGLKPQNFLQSTKFDFSGGGGLKSPFAIPQVKPQAPTAPQPQAPPTPQVQLDSIRSQTFDIQSQFRSRERAEERDRGSNTAIPEKSDAQKSVEASELAIENFSRLSPEELSTQKDLDNLISSFKKGVTGIKGKVIPLEFQTGQLQALEDRALDLAEPLESKLARLQGARTASLEASKFSLERADKRLETETTGDPFTLGKDQTRFDAEGNIIARGGGLGADTGLAGGAISEEAQRIAELVQSGGAKLSDIKDENLRREVLNALTQEPTVTSPQVQRQLGQSSLILGKVSDALGQITGLATGFTGQVLRGLGGTEAFDLSQTIDTIKANIGFGELQAMRNASPTGGALGQVSELELQLLTSVIGSLDTAQSKEQLTENLNEVQDFFQKFQDDQALKLIQEVPSITDEQIEVFLRGGDISAFSGVGGDTNQALNLPQRNKNPGNIKGGGLADSLAIGQDDQGHLIFPNAEIGFQALQKDLKAKITGNSRFVASNDPTIAEVGKAFAEDPNWSKGVARILGVNTSTKASAVDFNNLMQAVATQEGFYA